MCEYHYRKGVYEATMEPDSVEAQKYAADDDGYMTIRRFGKPTKAYLVRFYQMFRNQIKFVNGPCYKCPKMADDCYGGCCNEGTIGCRK